MLCQEIKIILMDKNDLIFITGAGGFIGSNLTEELVVHGYKVRVLLKNGESEKNIKHLVKKIEVVRGNLLDKSSLIKACKGISVVFHLAAKADMDKDIYKPYYVINVKGTQNLVEACSNNLKKFVFYSSILAVGLPNTSILLTEDYQGVPKHSYGRSKKEAEDYLISLYQNKKFPVTILRPTTVYGPRETAVQYFLFKMIQEGKFFMIGKGDNLMAYVYVKNLVDATIEAAKSKKTDGQIYFINDAKPYEYKDVANTIYTVLNKKLSKIYIPFWFAYVGSAMFGHLCKLIGVKPLIYPSRVKTMVLNYAYSIEKAQHDFGYSPKYNLSMGVEETYNWYKSNKMLK